MFLTQKTSKARSLYQLAWRASIYQRGQYDFNAGLSSLSKCVPVIPRGEGMDYQ
jgi:hypothetical protein